MYKILFVALLTVLMASQSASSQSVTINDLFRFHQLDRDEMDDMAMARGYTHNNPHELAEDLVRDSYQRYKGPEKTYQVISAVYHLESVLLKTAYTTTSQSEYIALKNQLKQKGYKYTATLTEEGVTEHYYESRTTPKYSVCISQNQDEVTGQMMYMFSVTDASAYHTALLEIREKQERRGYN